MADDVPSAEPMRYNRARGRFAAWAAPSIQEVLAMDTNTIDAMCNILLVVIGIIGLLLVRRE